MKRALFGVMCALAAATLHGQTKRPLAIEDYYRVLTIGNPQIAEDGLSATFTVATRVEDDNSTKTETFRVMTDGYSQPAKVETAPARTEGAAGQRGRGGRGNVPIPSPDGTWVARLRE